MINGFPVITLCGSTKFKDYFIRIQEELTLRGYIVLSVCVFSHADNLSLSQETLDMLEKMHQSRIDVSDEIYIVNVNDYIGEGLWKEISYAKSLGKGIQSLSPIEGLYSYEYYKH